MGGKVIFKRPKVEEALRLKPKWPVKLKKELQTEKHNIKELEEKLVALIDKDYGFSEDRY